MLTVIKLLDEYAHQKGLMLVPEVSLKNKQGKTVTPDGTLKDSLRQDWGYWESKDESDDIDEEIRKKFAKGYQASAGLHPVLSIMVYNHLLVCLPSGKAACNKRVQINHWTKSSVRVVT